MPRMLIICGVALAAVGLLMLAAQKLGFRGLPGDIHYESPRLKVSFPIVTCLAVSILLTLLMWLWQWFKRP